MQAISNLIAGLLSALAALAFAQFGVSLEGKPAAKPRPVEVHRILQPARDSRASADNAAPATHAPGQA